MKNYDVTNYGAIGDGVVDDTAAIQAAENYRSATGGILFFPTGTYKVTGITVSRLTTGGGWKGLGAKLIAGANGAIILNISGAQIGTAAKPFTIENLWFDGNAHTGVCAIKEVSPYNTSINMCTMSNLAWAAIFNRGRGVNISNIQQYGQGQWLFSGVGTGVSDRIFEVNITNVNHQDTGGTVWEQLNWFYFYRAINCNMNNIVTASLDGAASGIRCEGACEGIFVSNAVIVWPINGMSIIAGADGIYPAYVYVSNVGFDQPTVTGIDNYGFVTRFSNVNVTFGNYRTNTGYGMAVRSVAYDCDLSGVRISDMQGTGLLVENGVTGFRACALHLQNNFSGGTGYDLDLSATVATDVCLYGPNKMTTYHATGQTIANGATVFPGSAAAGTVTPQGRLTLQTLTPVMTASQAAKTTLYYTPYVGATIPIFDGTAFSNTAFAELSAITTDTTKSPAVIGVSKVNDWFVWNDGGTIRLSHGPDWTNDTTRAASVDRVAGILVNSTAITNGPAATLGTYVGTTRSNASSKLDFIFGSSALLGSAAFFGVWNMYNRVSVDTQVRDTTASWTYNGTAARAANNSTSMRISYIYGQAEDSVSSTYNLRMLGQNIVSGNSFCGIGVDSLTSSGSTGSVGAIAGAGNQDGSGIATYNGNPGIGFHYVQAIEYVAIASTNGTFFGNNSLSCKFLM